MQKKKTLILTECASMLALATVLGFVKVWEMPMGGSVTLFSMLPIVFISVKYDWKIGMGTGFLYSLIQLFMGIGSGNVFPYCETALTVIIVVLFDYLVPFTILGLSGIFKKYSYTGVYIGAVMTIVIRFCCHFITGFSVWGQWKPDGMGKYYYSFIYNGAYMLPELIITVAGLVFLVQIPQVRKLIGIKIEKKITED